MNFEYTSNAYIDAQKAFVAQNLINRGVITDTNIDEVIPKLHFTYVVMENKLDATLPSYDFNLRGQQDNNFENKKNEILLRDKDHFYPLFFRGAVAQYDTDGYTLGNAALPKTYIDTTVHTDAAVQAALRTLWNNGATVQLLVNDDPVSDELPVIDAYSAATTPVTMSEKGFIRFRPNASIMGNEDPVLRWKLAPGVKTSIAGPSADATLLNKVVVTLAGFKYSGEYNSVRACGADLALKNVR